MKTLAVCCWLYVEIDDTETEDEAVERLLMMINPDIEVNILNYELRNDADGTE